MKFRYTIIYVPEVARSLAFFQEAFGLEQRFITEGGDYGELATGETTLAFASIQLGTSHFPPKFTGPHAFDKSLGVEVALIAEDVKAAHARALAAGGTELAPPTAKPWGQLVSFLRTPDGLLIELCSPPGGA